MAAPPGTKSRTRAALNIPFSLFTVNIGWSSGKKTSWTQRVSGRSQTSRHHDTRYDGYCVNCGGYGPVPAWAWEPPYPCFHHRNSQKSYRRLTVDSILSPRVVAFQPIPGDLRLLSVPLPVKDLTAHLHWLPGSGSVQERPISAGTNRWASGFGRFQVVVLPDPELKTEAGCLPCLHLVAALHAARCTGNRGPAAGPPRWPCGRRSPYLSTVKSVISKVPSCGARTISGCTSGMFR